MLFLWPVSVDSMPGAWWQAASPWGYTGDQVNINVFNNPRCEKLKAQQAGVVIKWYIQESLFCKLELRNSKTWSKHSRKSFYDWAGVVIYDKKPEEIIILQRSGNNFNKLARAPLLQQPVSISRLVQDFNKRKWFTKEIPRTQKCLMGGGEKEKLALVYHLGYTCLSRGKGLLAKGRTLKNSHCCKIPILMDSLWP